MPPENSFISKGGGDPSGFSVVTDSLSKARNEHFERELSRMKLPSIALGSPEGSQSGDADEEGEGILFSGLNYGELPDLGCGVGQPSKQQGYVTASFEVDEVETKAEVEIGSGGGFGSPVQSSKSEEAEAVDDFSSGATPASSASTPVFHVEPRAREDEYATPGKAVDFDYYLGGLDLDDLLTRLEKNEVHNGLVTPSMNTPVAQGGEGAAEIRQDGDVGGRLEDEAMEEPKDAEPSGVGNVPAEDGEDFGGATMQVDEEDGSASVCSDSCSSSESAFAVASHPVADLWDEDEFCDGEEEEYIFAPQRVAAEDVATSLAALHARGFALLTSRALALPGRFYHMPGEVGLLLRVAKPNSNPDECALGLQDKGLHRFHTSREVEDALVGASRERRMSAARLSALLLNSHCRGAAPNNAESHSRTFTVVCVRRDLGSLGSSIEALLGRETLPADKVVEGDRANLHLCAAGVVSAEAMAGRDADLLDFSSAAARAGKGISPLKEERLAESRRAALGSEGCAVLLVFGPNARGHALSCLSADAAGALLGVACQGSEAYFAQKHLRGPLVSPSEGPRLDLGSVVDGLGEETSACRCDIALSRGIYLESFLRSLGKKKFSLVSLSTETEGQDDEGGAVVVGARRKDGARELAYAVHVANRIAAGRDPRGVSCISPAQVRGGRFRSSDRLRKLGQREGLTALVLGPYDEGGEERGGGYQDLAEVLKFARKGGFALEALSALRSSQDAKAFDRAAKGTGDGTREGGILIMAAFSREVAVMKMQMLLGGPGGPARLLRPLRRVPKTKEEVLDLCKTFKCGV